MYDGAGAVSCTSPCTVMFQPPAGKGLPTAPAGSATWGTPIALSSTEIRSTRRGTSGPAIGPGICPSTGTKVKSALDCH